MFCIHCGSANPEDASFCNMCGTAIAAPPRLPTADTAPQIIARDKQTSGDAGRQSLSPIAVSVQPTRQPQVQYLPSPTGKRSPVLWILAGFGACLLIVIVVALSFRGNRNISGPGPGRDNANYKPDATASPSSDPPPPAPASESTAAPSPDNTPPAASALVQQPPVSPAPPQNPIVGDWKATTFIGSSIGLHLGSDGRYVLNPGSDEGVYVFSTGDGTLRLQSNSFFSKEIMVWSCQVSGDSLSCVDPEGAGHIYTRIK